MTAYRLLIAVEYVLPNWSLVDFGKECCHRYNVVTLMNNDRKMF